MGDEALRDTFQADRETRSINRGPAALAASIVGVVTLFEMARVLASPFVQKYIEAPLALGGVQALIICVAVWLGSRRLLRHAQAANDRRTAALSDEMRQLEQSLSNTEGSLQMCREEATQQVSDLRAQLAAHDDALDSWCALAATAAQPQAPDAQSALLANLCLVTTAEAGALIASYAGAGTVVSPELSKELSDALRQAAEAVVPNDGVCWSGVDGQPHASMVVVALNNRGRASGAAALLFADQPSAVLSQRVTSAAGLVALALQPPTEQVEAITTATEVLQAAEQLAPSSERPFFVATGGESLYDLLARGQLTKDEGLRFIRALSNILAPFHSRNQPFMLRPHSVHVDLASGEVSLRQNLITQQTATYGAEYFEGFSAPELLSHEASPASDVFALGVYLFMLFVGRRPPTNRSLELVLDHLRISDTPLGITYLLRKALWPQPAHRLKDASAVLGLLDAIAGRGRLATPEMAPRNFDIGAELHVGLNKGRYRGANIHDLEDRIFWDYNSDRRLFLFAVADGVSHATIGSGSEAAVIVAEEATHAWKQINGAHPRGAEPEAELRGILERSSRKVVARFAPKLSAWRGNDLPEPMAAAACLAMGQLPQITIANVGDVHAFLVAPPFVARITQPHTSVADALSDPAVPNEAFVNMSGSTLTQTVGMWRRDKGKGAVAEALAPAITRLALLPGESLVLASDGLYGYAREPGAPFEDTLLTVLESTTEAQRAAFRLMTLANNRGGGDNISCIVCRAVAEGGL